MQGKCLFPYLMAPQTKSVSLILHHLVILSSSFATPSLSESPTHTSSPHPCCSPLDELVWPLGRNKEGSVSREEDMVCHSARGTMFLLVVLRLQLLLCPSDNLSALSLRDKICQHQYSLPRQQEHRHRLSFSFSGTAR